MTLEEHADRIARHCIVPHAVPVYVATTHYQIERVIADAKAQILIELKDLLSEYHIRFQ